MEDGRRDFTATCWSLDFLAAFCSSSRRTNETECESEEERRKKKREIEAKMTLIATAFANLGKLAV
jgi:hypothetical protein